MRTGYKPSRTIVRWGNILIGGIILLSAMVLSWNHTAALFEWAGYQGWLAQIGVLMIEASFFLGALNIILAKSSGLKAGWPARVTFLFGATLVGWSNISSGRMLFSQEDTAVILGVAIPLAMFLMEANVSRALFMFRDSLGETTRAGDNNRVGETTRAGDNNRVSESAQAGDNNRVSESAQAGDNNRVGETTRAGDNNRVGESARAGDNNRVGESARAGDNNRVGETTRAGDNSRVGEITRVKRSTGNVVFLNQKLDQRIERFRKPGEVKKAVKVALNYQKQHGELPSRRLLKEMSGCTEHVARQALQVIEEVGVQTG